METLWEKLWERFWERLWERLWESSGRGSGKIAKSFVFLRKNKDFERFREYLRQGQDSKKLGFPKEK